MSSSNERARACNDPRSLDDDLLTNMNQHVSSDEPDLNHGTRAQASGSSSHNRNPSGLNQHGGRVREFFAILCSA